MAEEDTAPPPVRAVEGSSVKQVLLPHSRAHSVERLQATTDLEAMACLEDVVAEVVLDSEAIMPHLLCIAVLQFVATHMMVAEVARKLMASGVVEVVLVVRNPCRSPSTSFPRLQLLTREDVVVVDEVLVEEEEHREAEAEWVRLLKLRLLRFTKITQLTSHDWYFELASNFRGVSRTYESCMMIESKFHVIV
jgi:hypothetical protein